MRGGSSTAWIPRGNGSVCKVCVSREGLPSVLMMRIYIYTYIYICCIICIELSSFCNSLDTETRDAATESKISGLNCVYLSISLCGGDTPRAEQVRFRPLRAGERDGGGAHLLLYYDVCVCVCV